MIDVPFIPKHEIENKANNLLCEFWSDGYPIPPKLIWENKMSKFFDTIPNLLVRTGIEAYLDLDLTTIVLDQEIYMSSGHGRLNFSIAHEIGHFLLHRSILQSDWKNGFTPHPATPSIWKHQLKECDPFAYYKVEKQANIFAAFFLMPSNMVVEAANDYFPFLSAKQEDCKHKFSSDEVQSYLASCLAKDFETSKQAMEIRLRELDIFEIFRTKYPSDSIKDSEG